MTGARMTKRCLLLLSSLAAFAAALAAPAEAQPAEPFADGAHRGYLAARLLEGGALDVIDESNADRLFVPASVLKVLTVAAALEHLGAEYRWRTRLTSTGAVDGEALHGDLVVEPGADPTWGPFFDDGADEPLAALADQVRAQGITRIRGDLVVEAGRFPGRMHPVDRALDDIPYRHGTPPAGLAVDEATIRVGVSPGTAIGAPARVRATDDLGIINLTMTVGGDRHGDGSIDFLPVWGTDTLLIRGEYPITEAAFELPASDPAPGLRAARRLRDALAEAGIVVEGAVRLRRRIPPPPANPDGALAVLRSPPLGELLPDILTRSHNWYADTLALTLGLEVAGTGRFDDGVAVIADFAVDLPAEDAADAPALALRDGSGLSSANLLTPAAVVRVLARAAGQPWGGALIDALAGPGEGTLAAWPRLPPLAAKTGTLRHTVALAGILAPDADTPVVFCYFVNHDPRPRSAARSEIAAAIRRWRTEDGRR